MTAQQPSSNQSVSPSRARFFYYEEHLIQFSVKVSDIVDKLMTGMNFDKLETTEQTKMLGQCLKWQKKNLADLYNLVVQTTNYDHLAYIQELMVKNQQQLDEFTRYQDAVKAEKQRLAANQQNKTKKPRSKAPNVEKSSSKTSNVEKAPSKALAQTSDSFANLPISKDPASLLRSLSSKEHLLLNRFLSDIPTSVPDVVPDSANRKQTANKKPDASWWDDISSHKIDCVNNNNAIRSRYIPWCPDQD